MKSRRVYKYICDECGWTAYRGEIIPVDLCSRCGYEGQPTVETIKFEIPDSYNKEEMQRSAEVFHRFLEGEDYEEAMEAVYGGKEVEAVGAVLGGAGLYQSLWAIYSDSGKSAKSPDSRVY